MYIYIYIYIYIYLCVSVCVCVCVCACVYNKYLFYVLSIQKSFKTFPKHNGAAFISKCFALNFYVSTPLTLAVPGYFCLTMPRGGAHGAPPA